MSSLWLVVLHDPSATPGMGDYHFAQVPAADKASAEAAALAMFASDALPGGNRFTEIHSSEQLPDPAPAAVAAPIITPTLPPAV